MIGTKRRSVSLQSNADDNSFQTRRVVAESSIGGQAEAPTQVDTSTTPSLDRRRAARQHVRALNTEFASWVQSQMQGHPDELWEDGVRDYLTHASGILERFTDVVNWLKVNTGDEGAGGLVTSLNSGASGTQSSINGSPATSSAWSFGLSTSSQALSQSSGAGLSNSWSSNVFSNSNTLSPNKAVSFSALPGTGVSPSTDTAPLATTASFMSSASSGVFSNTQAPLFGSTSNFATSWTGGALSNSQTAFKFGGNNSSAASNDNAKENADGDGEPEQPSSPSVKKSEEKGIVVVHETKCKLYLKSTDPKDEPWKDKGMGQLVIKCQEGASKGTKESKPRIIVRNDVGKIMLNALLYPGIKTNLQKNAVVAIFHTLDDGGGESGKATAVARTFLMRTKNEEERNKLADAIRDHAPTS